jgi:putative molybdopterin biosynthesis protein
MEFLTTSEAAEYLRLGERKLYEIVTAGAIPCSKVTGKWLFPRHELDLWVLSGLARPAGMIAAEPPPIVGGSQDSLLEWSLRECGAGFASRGAAKSAGLDFVPLLWENFDLAMRQRAEELTGYDPLPAGQIRFAA